jgi:hypothetical protein
LDDEMKAVETCGICGRYKGKREGKRPLGRRGSRWEVKVKVKQYVYGHGQAFRTVGG